MVVGPGRRLRGLRRTSAAPVTTPRPDASPVPTSEPVQSPAATGEPASPPVDSPAPSGSPASPDPSATTAPSPGAPVASPAPTPDAGSPAPGSPTPAPTPESRAATRPRRPPRPPSRPRRRRRPRGHAGPGDAAPHDAAGDAGPDRRRGARDRRGRRRSSARRRRTAPTAAGSPSPPARPTGRTARTSTRGASGEQRARALTDDHGSVFSGWLDGRILASAARVAEAPGAESPRAAPPPDADPASVVARSFLVDPADGSVDRARARRRLATGRRSDGADRRLLDRLARLERRRSRPGFPRPGRLVAAEWQALLDGAARRRRHGHSRGRPPATSVAGLGGPLRSRRPPPRRLGRRSGGARDRAPGARRRRRRRDARRRRSSPTRPRSPAFSLDSDRLAWSTPPGRNGQGSLVTVYAWRGDAAGQLHSVPDPGRRARRRRPLTRPAAAPRGRLRADPLTTGPARPGRRTHVPRRGGCTGPCAGPVA